MTERDTTQHPSAALAPGTTLNGIFTIEEKLAAGGMGEVYRGFNIATGDPVAIKIVLKEFARDETIVGLFFKEARILNSLHHPAIVRYGVFTIDPVLERPYLVMEFIDGKSLADVIDGKPMSTADTKVLVSRLAAGLDAGHKAGVIHREMSPDNVILPNGKVRDAKIIDFGIARASNVGTGTLLGGKFAGKYNFVSPEQLGLFGGEVTEASDLYSLGLLTVNVLRGQPIDMNGSQFEVVEKRRTVPDLSDIDPELRQGLDLMLQPDPANRTLTMAEISDWLAPEVERSKSHFRNTVHPGAISVPSEAATAAIGQSTVIAESGPGTASPSGATPSGATPSGALATSAEIDPFAGITIQTGPEAQPASSGTATVVRGATPKASSRRRMLWAAAVVLLLICGGAVAFLSGSLSMVTGSQPTTTASPVLAPQPQPVPTPPEEVATSDTPAGPREPAPNSATAPADDAVPAKEAVPEEQVAASGQEPAPGSTPSGTSPSSTSPSSAAPSLPVTPPVEDLAPPDVVDDSPQQPAPVAPLSPPIVLTPSPEPERPPQSGESTQGMQATEPVEKAPPEPPVQAPPPESTAAPATPEAPSIIPEQPEDKIASLPGTSQASPETLPADHPLPPPEWVKAFAGGDCFFARDVASTDTSMTIEAMAAEEAPAEKLDEGFRQQFGFEPYIEIRAVKPSQCSVAAFLKALPWTGLPPMEIDLETDQLKGGEPVRGAIGAFARPDTFLYLIDHNGMVRQIDPPMKKGKEGWFTLTLVGPKVNEPSPQVLLALSSDRPIEGSRIRDTTVAGDFFPALLKAILDGGAVVNSGFLYLMREDD